MVARTNQSPVDWPDVKHFPWQASNNCCLKDENSYCAMNCANNFRLHRLLKNFRHHLPGHHRPRVRRLELAHQEW